MYACNKDAFRLAKAKKTLVLAMRVSKIDLKFQQSLIDVIVRFWLEWLLIFLRKFSYKTCEVRILICERNSCLLASVRRMQFNG